MISRQRGRQPLQRSPSSRSSSDLPRKAHATSHRRLASQSAEALAGHQTYSNPLGTKLPQDVVLALYAGRARCTVICVGATRRRISRRAE